LGENGLLWRVKVGTEHTAVESEGWARTDCSGEFRLKENGLLWRVKVRIERTALESEGWERMECCGK